MTKTRTVAWVLLALAMTACSNNPLMRGSQATSTESAQAIDKALAEAQQKPVDPSASTRNKQPASLPPAVTQALLPPLQDEPAGDDSFDVSARDVEASAFFSGLVKGTRYNVVVHPDIQQAISLTLNDVTVPEVMTIAGDLYDFDIQRQGRLYRVMPGGLKTRLFPIDYLNFKRRGASETRVSSGQVSDSRSGSANNNATGNAGNASNQQDSSSSLVGTRISTETESDFWASLKSTVGMIVGDESDARVIVNPGAGLVMVRADAKTLSQVENYLRKTQLIMQRQVILEAKILEISLNKGYQQGINWSDIQSASSVTATDGFPAEYTAESLAGQAVTSADIGGVFSASFREGTFTALIKLLGKQGNVQILSSPRISTVNNQKAVIKVGTDEFFVTDIDFQNDNAVNNTTQNTNTSVQLTPFFSGISLDVTPQIAEDGSVTLHVHPSVSEVNDQEKIITIGDRDVTLPLARSKVRETDSVIRADSGQIVVIGGLIQNKSEDNNAAVPFFSEVPVLGEFFKQRNFTAQKSELVILLRPTVTNATAYQDDIAASHKRMSVLRQVLESSDSVTPRPERARR